MILQGRSLEALQRGFDTIVNALNTDLLIINPSKCELLTENSEDTIKVPNSDDLLYSKDTAKYFGQTMDPKHQKLS